MPSVPRRLLYACGLTLALAVLYLHHEVLLKGMVYHLEDAADGYYPSHVAILRAYGEGVLPTWERGSWCGWPLVADPYYGAFYPLTVLLALFGAVRGVGPTIALHMGVAAGGTFWLLRRRKLDLGPALLGAAALGFSTFMVVRIRHIIFAELMAWLPLCLCGIEGWLQSRRPRELVLAAAATGLAILCGALPLAPYMVLLMVAYVAPRVWREPAKGRSLLWLAAAATVGGLLGAAQVVPTVAHLPYSPRSLGADYAFASSYAWPNLQYLGTMLAPDLFGTEERTRWFGQFNHWEMAGYYVGALVVLLAPLGLLRARRRPELWALAGVALLGIGLAFGDKGPFHGWFFRHVPLYAALRCPTRALVMDLVALPILAAEGLSWLVERDWKRRVPVGAALAALFVLASAGGVWWIRHPHHVVAANEAVTRAAFVHLTLVVGAGAAVLALLATAILNRRAAGLLLALITLVDLVSIERGYVVPRPSDWAPGTDRFAAVDWLLAQKPPGAVVMDRFIPDARGPFRLHNLGLTYGIESAGGYDSVSVWHYVHFLWILNNRSPYPHKSLKDDLAAGTVKRFDTPLVDLLNVRWAVASNPPAADWVLRFHRPPGEKPHARHEPQWDAELNVYENPHVLPRAFLVYSATVLPDDAAQARALVTLNPRQTVLLDRAPEPAPIGDQRAFRAATVLRAERHYFSVEAETDVPGVLVMSETDYPGWSATVDGKPAPLLRADYTFRAVALPPGKHLVELRFVSRPTRVGLGLSLFGLFALFGLWAGARRARRGE